MAAQKWQDRIVDHKRMPVADLAAAANALNPRRHTDDQRTLFRHMAETVGLVADVIVNKHTGRMIDGHMRVEEAAAAGEADLPVTLVDLDEDEERRILATFDPIGGLSTYDGEAYRRLVDGIGDADGAFRDALGGLIDGLAPMKPGQAVGEDDVPEPTADPVTRPGDLWVLGEHRLLCGDATSADDVARLGDHGHLMVTDPPYGVEYDPDWRNRADRANGKPYGASSVGRVSADDRADWREAWTLFSGDVAYTWSAAGGFLVQSGSALLAAGFELRGQIIWRKQHFVISRGNYHGQHEPCWYAVRKGRKSHWTGDRTQSTIWEVSNASSAGHSNVDDGKTNHSTQKPVEVMRRPMVNNSTKGDLVYDPFVGSGTTIIAAESIGRRCRALEIDPAYCDIVVVRWQRFTGRAATLDGTDKTFDEIKAERTKPPRKEEVHAAVSSS